MGTHTHLETSWKMRAVILHSSIRLHAENWVPEMWRRNASHESVDGLTHASGSVTLTHLLCQWKSTNMAVGTPTTSAPICGCKTTRRHAPERVIIGPVAAASLWPVSQKHGNIAGRPRTCHSQSTHRFSTGAVSWSVKSNSSRYA